MDWLLRLKEERPFVRVTVDSVKDPVDKFRARIYENEELRAEISYMTLDDLEAYLSQRYGNIYHILEGGEYGQH